MAPTPRRSVPIRASLLLIALLVLATATSSALSAVAFAPATSPGSRSAPATAAWEWPIEPPVRLLEPFRAPPTPYSAGHRGIDLAAPPEAVVRAAADGVVAFAGPVAGRGVLSIDHGDGVVSAIEPVVASVAVGDRVLAARRSPSPPEAGTAMGGASTSASGCTASTSRPCCSSADCRARCCCRWADQARGCAVA